MPDDLTECGTKTVTYEITPKAVTWFIPVDQVRQRAADEADASLTESIRRHGVLQPVGARPCGKLVWGHRRLRCGVAAGLSVIPTIVLLRAMTEGEFLVLQMVENVARESLSQHDLWRGCERLIEANNFQLKDVAKALSLDPSTLTRIMSPSKVIPGAVEALKSGKINLGHTYALSKVEGAEEQERLLNLALAGATRDALETEVRKLRKPEKPTLRLSRVACKLESGVQVAVSGESLDLDAVLEALAEAGKLARRTRDQGGDVKSFNALMKAKAGA